MALHTSIFDAMGFQWVSTDATLGSILDWVSKVVGVSGTQTMISFYEFQGVASSFR